MFLRILALLLLVTCNSLALADCIKDEYNLKEFNSYDLFFSIEPYKSANCIEDKDWTSPILIDI
jgi:hypothetical protein